MQATLRALRILWIALLVSLAIFAYIPEALGVSRRPPAPIVFLAIALVAVWIVGSVFLMRRRWILRAATVLLSDPENARSLARWRAGYLMCFALAHSIGLYGLVLRFVGFTFSQVAPFYLGAIGLMLYLLPRVPSDQTK